MSLEGIAAETMKIVEAGHYSNSSGRMVSIRDAQTAAERGTRHYTPEQARALLRTAGVTSPARLPTLEVTGETTQVAAHRLVVSEGCRNLVLLNFASARNPGGGFVTGAKAQEEDLARSSGLYACQLTQPAYYEANRRQESMLYTDHVIYSPAVPWFRTTNRDLLDDVFLASIVTAPAPNAGQALPRDSSDGCRAEIAEALDRRAGIVLAVARDNGHRTLVLGAWGCGAFRNDPAMVADTFGRWLEGPAFSGCFDRVVFAVYTAKHNATTLPAFEHRAIARMSTRHRPRRRGSPRGQARERGGLAHLRVWMRPRRPCHLRPGWAPFSDPDSPSSFDSHPCWSRT